MFLRHEREHAISIVSTKNIISLSIIGNKLEVPRGSLAEESPSAQGIETERVFPECTLGFEAVRTLFLDPLRKGS